MNLVFDLKFRKLNDLCDQVFDYFHLTYYDLESKIDNELNIHSIKSKFETFADKHFKSAIKDFENEIQYLKNKSPNELIKPGTLAPDSVVKLTLVPGGGAMFVACGDTPNNDIL